MTGRIVLHRVGALVAAPTPSSLVVVRDAFVLCADGRVRASGAWSERASAEAAVDEVSERPDLVATPPFVDAHVHLGQLDVRGARSARLLDWLRDTVYPEEARFADAAHARAVARRFFRALAAFGTLGAGVFLPSQEEAAWRCFEEGARSPLHLAMGRTMMDRNVPRSLADDSPEAALAASERLADAFHRRGRLRYAFAPRYAPACSARLLALAGKAAAARQCGVATHLAETTDEADWVRRLFPYAPDYLAVYEGTGLSGPRTVFGHGVHLSGTEWNRVVAAGAWVAHCPLSNDALGSGRFPFERAPAGANVALATDVGASPSVNMLDAMARAHALHPRAAVGPARLLHLATAAGARALGVPLPGSLAPGSEASFLLWKPLDPPGPSFDGSAFLDDLLARAREAGPERIRPERVIAAGEAVSGNAEGRAHARR